MDEMSEGADNSDGPFPWHLGVYDAHCHPTDTMSSIPSIQNMKTRILTVMATRAEDQELVTSVAENHGVKSPELTKWTEEECIVPCFGWHPWFSHQMYFGEDLEGEDQDSQGVLKDHAKIRHYQKVFQPSADDASEEHRQILLSLPDPTPFSEFLAQTRKNLEKYSYALVGEIGLDRAFRVPEAWLPDSWEKRNDNLTPGGREGRRLTPFKCRQQHQKKIFKQQLQLAADMDRAVSVHGVQAHGLVFDTLKELWEGHEKEVLSKRERKKRGADHPSVEAEISASASAEAASVKPYPPRICLHSYSGNPSNFRQYLNPAIPVHIYASFSTAINLSDAMESETPRAFEELIRLVPDNRLLVESDLHIAGDEMDKRMEDIVRRICKVKGWDLEDGVKTLGNNWRQFVFGMA